jgi:nucleoside phosphorylase
MSDEFSLYEDGISHLLKALEKSCSPQLYRNALLMQMELAHNIKQAKKHGSSPARNADLYRILEQLIDLSLLTTGKSFYEWCQIQVAAKQEQPPDLSDLGREGLAQELLEAFIKLGARPKEGQNFADEDLLERYASVPLHAVFLYTSEDEAVASYILNNWEALDSLSGTICDIHPILEQFQHAGNAYDYIKKIDVVKESSFNNLSQLPGLFFWDHAGDTAFVSFGGDVKAAHITNVLRVVFEELSRQPSLAAVNRAKQILSQAQQPTLSGQAPAIRRLQIQQPYFPEQTRRADIGIIIALQEEFDVFFPTIAKIQQAESDPESGISFFHFDAPAKANQPQPYRCVTSLLGKMGPTKATQVTQRMIDLYQPHTFVVLGIAAGIHSDVNLGDVIIADSVDSYIDRGKLIEFEKEDRNVFPLSLSGQVYQCSADLLHSMHAFKYVHPTVYKQWRQSSTRFWKKRLATSPQPHLMQAINLQRPVTYTIGPLASGPLVVASSSFKELLLQRNRSLLGIEMEASGVLAAFNQTVDRKRSLVLRGVSDYGDERKTELDQIQHGILRQFAMYNTVELFWKLLETGFFPKDF